MIFVCAVQCPGCSKTPLLVRGGPMGPRKRKSSPPEGREPAEPSKLQSSENIANRYTGRSGRWSTLGRSGQSEDLMSRGVCEER